jgi:hypothetical protein
MGKQASQEFVYGAIGLIAIAVLLVGIPLALYFTGGAVMNAIIWLLGGDAHRWLPMWWFAGVGVIYVRIGIGISFFIVCVIAFLLLQLALVILACGAEAILAIYRTYHSDAKTPPRKV